MDSSYRMMESRVDTKQSRDRILSGVPVQNRTKKSSNRVTVSRRYSKQNRVKHRVGFCAESNQGIEQSRRGLSSVGAGNRVEFWSRITSAVDSALREVLPSDCKAFILHKPGQDEYGIATQWSGPNGYRRMHISFRNPIQLYVSFFCDSLIGFGKQIPLYTLVSSDAVMTRLSQL